MIDVSALLKLKRSRLPAAVLVMGLFLSTLAAISTFRAFDSDESQRFAEAVDEIRSDLQVRLDSFANSIRQIAAAYGSNPNMGQTAFLNYAQTAGIRSNDASTFSYGVFQRTAGPTPDEDRYVLKLRQIADGSPSPGVLLGTDVSKDPYRIDLFRRAIDSGGAELTTRMPGLVASRQPGQMMTVAIYAGNRIPTTIEERRKLAIGISYVRLGESGLFDQVLKNSGSYKNHLSAQIYDGTAESTAQQNLTPLYERRINPSRLLPELMRSEVFEIKMGTHVFTVRILSAHSQFWSVAGFVSILILSIGVGLSLLLFRLIRQRELRSDRLLKSERQLKLVTESLPVMIAYIDNDYVYRFNNRVYEDLLRRPRSEITNRRVADVVGPSYQVRFGHAIDRAMRGEHVEQNWSHLNARGEVRRFHQILLPDFNHRGDVKGVVSMSTDVTERVNKQERASFLEAVSSILATSLDSAVVSAKLTQKLLLLCDWCTIELLSEEGQIDHHSFAASSPARYEALASFYKQFPPNVSDRRINAAARLTKRTQYIPVASKEILRDRIPEPDRLNRFLAVGFQSIAILPLVSGERVLGTIALYSGDKDKPFSQEDVDFFEEIATRASLAFENARLYTQSLSINRAKDHFLAMLSHELRTPMNVILGWLEILTTEEVDKETYTQALDTLNRNANIQIQLINDLLDVSRIINGKLSLHATKGDVGAIVRGAIDSVRPAVRAKNIKVSFKTEGDSLATVDSERLQQVLWNLLSNAIKFTPSGGQIDIELTGSATDVQIRVMDSGQGIEESFLPFVFDRFRQEEGGFSRSQGGLGLGLSIVRYIVEGHGGTVSVESKGRGLGTTFTAILPKIAQIPDENHLTPSAFS